MFIVVVLPIEPYLVSITIELDDCYFLQRTTPVIKPVRGYLPSHETTRSQLGGRLALEEQLPPPFPAIPPPEEAPHPVQTCLHPALDCYPCISRNTTGISHARPAIHRVRPYRCEFFYQPLPSAAT